MVVLLITAPEEACSIAELLTHTPSMDVAQTVRLFNVLDCKIVRFSYTPTEVVTAKACASIMLVDVPTHIPLTNPKSQC